MKKKWLKGMAVLLEAVLLVTAPGLPVMADNIAENGWLEVTGGVEEVVRSVSGGDAEIIYPAPSMEWVDIWSLQLKLPEGFVADGEEHAYSFDVNISKDDGGNGNVSWSHTLGSFEEAAEIPVYYNLTESGTYRYIGYLAEDGRQVSEMVALEREYTAPADKLGTTTATWHDGSMPEISFPEIPHAKYYLISVVMDGVRHGGVYWSVSHFERHEDGTLWAKEDQIKSILSGGPGEYRVTIKAISENVMLYANGEESELSETFVFDGDFGKISTSDISEVKAGLTNEKVTEIEYNLPDGAEVSEADQEEIFSALKGTDKSLTLSFQNEDQAVGYQWTFEGKEIVDDTKTMNFRIIVDANVQDVIDCVDIGKFNEVDLAFLHEGELPGRATVTVNLQSKLGDAKTAHLYYYNPETKQLEVVAENLAIEDGHVAFPMSHCSNYILTAEMLKNLIPDREQAKPDSNTGSNTTNNTVSAPTEVMVEPVGASVISYMVEPGDTLKKIAAKFYGSREFWSKIYADNAGIIRNPNRIYAGQVLYIYLTDNPVEANEIIAGDTYTVQQGDSLWKIAKKLYGKGVLYSKIYEANKDVISNPKSLHVGQKIVIPQ